MLVKGVLVATALLGGEIIKEKTKTQDFETMNDCVEFIHNGIEKIKEDGVRIKTYEETKSDKLFTVEATGKYLFVKLNAKATCEIK